MIINKEDINEQANNIVCEFEKDKCKFYNKITSLCEIKIESFHEVQLNILTDKVVNILSKKGYYVRYPRYNSQIYYVSVDCKC